MPGCLVLHKGNPPALHRAGNDGCGHPLDIPGLGKGAANLVKIMAVNVDHVEIEGFQLPVNGIGRADLLYIPVDLQAIVVNDQHQVVQPAVAGKHGCLPDLSLLNLTVSCQGIHPVIGMIQLPCQSHAYSCRKALAQGSAGHIHAGNMLHIRMPLQIRAHMPQRGQILHREEAPVRQRGIKPRRHMPLGQHKPVPCSILGILGIYLHLLKIKIGEEICR